MFSKILLTLLVIGGAVLFLRARKRLSSTPTYRPPPTPERSPYAYEAVPVSRIRPWHWAAVFLLLASFAGSGWYLYHYWTDAYRIVAVTVVNSNTGESTTYQAYKGEIQQGAGIFRTVDGRMVSLSGVDRMEIGAR